MRLRTEQIAANKQETGHCFGARAEVWLSGSRVGDHQRGFTLTELITIMVIVGILSVAALPRFFDTNMFQARGAADQVKSALRYGQKVAIAQRRPVVSVNISTAASSNCSAVLAGGNINCVILDSVLGTGFAKTVSFNALGRLVDAGGGAIAANDTITVGSTTITIEAETGYVH